MNVPISENDQSATNNIRITCRGPGINGDYYMYSLEPDIVGIDSAAVWGSLSQQCPVGKAVGAFRTKYKDFDLLEDNIAIGDVEMYCADF